MPFKRVTFPTVYLKCHPYICNANGYNQTYLYHILACSNNNNNNITVYIHSIIVLRVKLYCVVQPHIISNIELFTYTYTKIITNACYFLDYNGLCCKEEQNCCPCKTVCLYTNRGLIYALFAGCCGSFPRLSEEE